MKFTNFQVFLIYKCEALLSTPNGKTKNFGNFKIVTVNKTTNFVHHIFLGN